MSTLSSWGWGWYNARMRYGVTLPYDDDPRALVGLAQDAEAAGWDGVFVWDGLTGNDPWVMLAAIAMQTTHLVLGPMLTPPSRRRPWKLAQETATLDRLSGGRLVLPVGLGAIDTGFANVGEETDRKTRAALLDESLEIVAGLWRGQPFTYEGTHYQVRDLAGSPTPVQQPRIPVWVVGAWPRMKSMRRALRWDGILPTKIAPDGSFADLTPDDLRALRAWIAEQRSDPTPVDIVLEGETPGADPARAAAHVGPLAEAGMTWWLENVWNTPRAEGGREGMRARIRQGPPRLP